MPGCISKPDSCNMHNFVGLPSRKNKEISVGSYAIITKEMLWETKIIKFHFLQPCVIKDQREEFERWEIWELQGWMETMHHAFQNATSTYSQLSLENWNGRHRLSGNNSKFNVHISITKSILLGALYVSMPTSGTSPAT